MKMQSRATAHTPGEGAIACSWAVHNNTTVWSSGRDHEDGVVEEINEITASAASHRTVTYVLDYSRKKSHITTLDALGLYRRCCKRRYKNREVIVYCCKEGNQGD